MLCAHRGPNAEGGFPIFLMAKHVPGPKSRRVPPRNSLRCRR